MQSTDNSEYVIHINSSLGMVTGVYGASSNLNDAKTIVWQTGEYEFKMLKEKMDEKWNKIIIEYDEDDRMSYRISVQKLGYLYNSKPTVYTTIYCKQVPKIIAKNN